jgi:hypothetical protein
MAVDEVGEFQDDFLALEWREFRPRPLEGAPCGRDRQVDVARVPLGDVASSSPVDGL